MEIKTEYYVDNQAAVQIQDGKTYRYSMDPAGRVRETKTETEGNLFSKPSRTTRDLDRHLLGPMKKKAKNGRNGPGMFQESTAP
jgi:hypothetical protein